LIDARQAPLLARPYYGNDGSASPLTRALAQVPELLDVTLAFVGRVYGETSIDLRTKEIAILRVSARSGCRYCVDTHTVAAWDAGLGIEETAGLCATPRGLSDREAALGGVVRRAVRRALTRSRRPPLTACASTSPSTRSSS